MLYDKYIKDNKTEYTTLELHFFIQKITGFDSRTIAHYLRKLDIMGFIIMSGTLTFQITDLIKTLNLDKKVEKSDVDNSGFFKY